MSAPVFFKKYQKYICLSENFAKIDKKNLAKKLHQQALLGPIVPRDKTTRILPTGEPDINWKIIPEEIKKTEEKVLGLLSKIIGRTVTRFIFAPPSPFSTRKKIIGFAILEGKDGELEQEVFFAQLPPKLSVKIISAVSYYLSEYYTM